VQKLLSTAEFAEAIGVSESSARRLTDAGDIRVHRTKGGHRKIPVEEAIRYLREQGIQPQNPQLLGISVLDEPAHGSFYDALVEGDSDQAVALIQTMYLSGMKTSDMFDGPVLDAFVKIGERFPDDKRSIFIEHRAVIIAMRSLMYLRTLMPPVNGEAPKAICAAPAGDPYLLSCLMCSLVLHEVGFQEINLGPDTPVDILMDAVRDERPQLVSLSITNVIRSKTQVAEIEKLDRVARDHQCMLVVGGNNADSLELPHIQRRRSMAHLQSLAVKLIG